MSARVVRLPDAEPRARRVAIGTFDGVHVGHREVIAGSDTVVTFEPHPVAILHPASTPRLLTTLERKARLAGDLGVEEIVVVPFDRERAAEPAAEFVDEVLVDALQATHVSVGENFRFGHKAKGDPALLAGDDRFETRVVPLLEVDGEVVSSSHIRGLILGGAVEYAGRLLGAPFTIAGEVVHGDERGRTLGYPTANLVPPEGYAVPGHGVYAARARTASGEERVGGRQRRRAPDVRHRARRADRGLPRRLRGRPVRHRAGDRVPQAPARREALRRAGRAHRPDGPRRRDDARDRGRLSGGAGCYRSAPP